MSIFQGAGLPLRLPDTPERPKSLPPIQRERELTEQKISLSARRNLSPIDKRVIWSLTTPRRARLLSEGAGLSAVAHVERTASSVLPPVYRPKRSTGVIVEPARPRGFIPPRESTGGTDQYYEVDDWMALPAAQSAQSGRTAFVQFIPSDRLLQASDVDVLIPRSRFRGLPNGCPSLRFPNQAPAYYYGNRPRCLAFYENTQGMERLAAGTEKGWLDIWNVHPGMEPVRLRTKKICSEPIVRIAVGGMYIVAATLSGKLYQINRESQKIIQFEEASHKRAVASLALSSDKSYLATGGADGFAVVYRKNEEGRHYEPLFRQPLFESGISALAFSNEPERPLLAAGQTTLGIWNLEDEEPIAEIAAGSRISAIFWLSGKKLCTTHADGTIRYYEFDRHRGKIEEVRRIQAHKQAIAYATYNGTDLLTTFSPVGNEIKSWLFSVPPADSSKSAFSPYKGMPRAGRG